jgi:hypothetical protein
MLTSNQTPIRIRFLGGALGGMLPRQKGFVENAQSFGQITSVPQGYNDPARALVPTIKTGGNISARFQGEAFYTADVRAFGNMAATFAAEATFTVENNVLFNTSATFAAEADMTVDLRATGNMSANFDILARPSAFDIAQEIWNAQASGYTGTGTMGKEVQDAKKAAKLAAALSA